MKILYGFLYFLLLVTVSLTSLMAGKYISWEGQTDEYEKYGFQLVSMAGSWVSALATLAAVIAAMYTVQVQIKEAQRLSMEERLEAKYHAAAQCISHAMSVINQLRGRVHSLKKALISGGRPVFSLAPNVSKIAVLFDQLLDKENFRYFPGPIIDEVNSLSGSFFGMEMLVQGVNLLYAEKQIQMLPAMDPAGLDTTFDEVDTKLDNLLTKLIDMRRELDRKVEEHNAVQ